MLQHIQLLPTKTNRRKWYLFSVPHDSLVNLHSCQWNVSLGDLPYKVGIGVEEHDVKVLHGVDRLQRMPVSKPKNLCT
jgi:hypothetical protein